MNSVNNGNAFLPTYLLADAASYLIGLAIAIAVNFLVFPTTSEKELRQMLVTSLSHVAELSGLIAKAYAMIAMESEMEKGEVLMQIMQADFVALNRILEDTGVEVNWSVYSMEGRRISAQKSTGIDANECFLAPRFRLPSHDRSYTRIAALYVQRIQRASTLLASGQTNPISCSYPINPPPGISY